MKQFNKSYDEPSIENINIFIIKRPKAKYALHHYLVMNKRANDYKFIEKAHVVAAKREGVYIKKDKLLEIINNIKNPSHQIAATIQFITGARACDILSIERKKIENVLDIPGIGLKINLTTKGRKERIVFIPNQFCNELVHFFNSKGSRPFLPNDFKDETKALELAYVQYWRDLKQAARKSGVSEFATHDFRRNFIDEAYTVFKDIRIVKDLVGHSNLNLTFRYLKKKISNEEFMEKIKILRG